MLFGGLWHGASWNFAIWGGIHGTWLMLERLMGRKSLYRQLPGIIRVALTFLIVLIAWVFFRAPDLPSAMRYLGSMFHLSHAPANALLPAGILYQPYYILALLAAALITWFAPQTWDWSRTISKPKAVVVVIVLLLSLTMLATQAFNPFIYFIF
ncbi:MAG: hypothetical protein KJ626_15380 [Verrucomicrobia bacterium]|nr:hypothetical protein [Verrucomicrobiota bacterium]